LNGESRGLSINEEDSKNDCDETLPNFIKRKHPRKERKRNKGQKLKSKQTNNPNEGLFIPEGKGTTKN